MSIIAFANRFHDPADSKVEFNDVGSDFSAAQPLTNMSRAQLPLFAEFTGPSCELEVAAVEDTSESPTVADSFDADVFALLGHTLTDGMEVEFLDGSVSLGTVTVANYPELPQHAILVLDSAVSLDTLTVSITGGASGTSYQIGAVWASESFRTGFAMADYAYTPESLSDLEYSDATGYANERPTQELYQARFPGLTRAEAEGPAWPNWRAISRKVGSHEPVIIIPDESELARSVYGRVETFTPIRPQLSKQASIWRAGVDIREER